LRQLFHKSDSVSRSICEGVLLAVITYLACSSVVVPFLTAAHAQSSPLFSVTLIASTGNPVRKQYVQMIADNMIAEGIDAKVTYLDFNVLVNRMFFTGSAKQGSSFDQGGYDIGFIGWGFTSPVPDFRANFDGRPAYLAPAGSNYALYNSAELNAVFDQFYATADPTVQKQLLDKAQEIVFRDKPYNYIYEPTDAIPINSKWTAWGSQGVYSEVTFPDVQHWSGGNQLTFAEVSNVFPDNNLNPLATKSSNSFYALYVYGAVCYSGAGLQDVDARTLQYYPALATSITHTPDLLKWNITIRQGAMFADGVEVTADDFVYTQYLLTNAKANSVGLGSNIQYLGNYVTFKLSDGSSIVDDNSAGAAHTTGSWTATGKYTFTFTLPASYALAGQTYEAFSPIPKHILEQIPVNEIDSSDYSTGRQHSYTWDAEKYGGSGSYTGSGPVCAGPYVLDNYDFTANVATLKKNPYYWNATGLKALGQYTIDTYKVAWIESKDAAITALQNGKVDVLDYNYQLAKDVPSLKSLPNVIIVNQTELGWQEQGFNMQNPIFGTGVDTPAGKADPTKAAEAALHIRTAISHMIPREQIIHDLLNGVGTPLASWIGPGWGIWYDPKLVPDTYDLGAAADELRAAGYVPLITATASASSSTVNVMTTSSTSEVTTSSLPSSTSTSLELITSVTPTGPSNGQSTLMLVIGAIVAVAALVAVVFKMKKRGTGEQSKKPSRSSEK